MNPLDRFRGDPVFQVKFDSYARIVLQIRDLIQMQDVTYLQILDSRRRELHQDLLKYVGCKIWKETLCPDHQCGMKNCLRLAIAVLVEEVVLNEPAPL